MGRIWNWMTGRGKRLDTGVTFKVAVAAYVDRISPKTFRGKDVAGRVGSGYDSIKNLREELEPLIARDFGGGSYGAKLFENDNRDNYVGYHTFKIAGDPLMDGKEIPLEGEEVGGKKKMSKVDEINAQTAALKAQKEEAQAERELRKARVGLDDDAEPPVVFDQGNSETVELLREFMAKQDKQAEDAKFERMLLAQAENTRMILETIKPREDSGGGVLEAIRMLMESSQANITHMMELSSKSEARTNDILMTMLSDKSSTSREVMAMFPKFIEMSIMMREGKVPGQEEEDIAPMALAAKVIGRAADSFDHYLETKAGVSEEEEEVDEDLVKNVVAEQIAASRRMQAPPEDPQQQQRRAGAARHAKIGKAVNGILNRIMEEVSSGVPQEKQTWQRLAQETLPGDVLARFMSAQNDETELEALILKYASEEVYAKLQRVLSGAQQKQAARQGAVAARAPKAVRTPPVPRSGRKPRVQHPPKAPKVPTRPMTIIRREAEEAARIADVPAHTENPHSSSAEAATDVTQAGVPAAAPQADAE